MMTLKWRVIRGENKECGPSPLQDRTQWLSMEVGQLVKHSNFAFAGRTLRLSHPYPPHPTSLIQPNFHASGFEY